MYLLCTMADIYHWFNAFIAFLHIISKSLYMKEQQLQDVNVFSHRHICVRPQHSDDRLQRCHHTRTSGVGGKSATDRKLTLFERCQEYVVLLAVIAVDKETPKCIFFPSQRTQTGRINGWLQQEETTGNQHFMSHKSSTLSNFYFNLWKPLTKHTKNMIDFRCHMINADTTLPNVMLAISMEIHIVSYAYVS